MAVDNEIAQRRARIAAVDRALLDLLNQRLQLVQELRHLKTTEGLAFHDPLQEARLILALQEVNPGPASTEAVAAVFRSIVAWTKEEASRVLTPLPR